MGGGEQEMTHPTWSVNIWNPEYWHRPSEGWEPVLSGMTLCAAMEVVANLESRGWDRDVSIWVHNYSSDELYQEWQKRQPTKKKATDCPAKKTEHQQTLFGE